VSPLHTHYVEGLCPGSIYSTTLRACNAHFDYLFILIEKIIYLYDLCDVCDFRDFNEELWLILLFNKIRFENQINIETLGCLVILKSFGEKE